MTPFEVINSIFLILIVEHKIFKFGNLIITFQYWRLKRCSLHRAYWILYTQLHLHFLVNWPIVTQPRPSSCYTTQFTNLIPPTYRHLNSYYTKLTLNFIMFLSLITFDIRHRQCPLFPSDGSSPLTFRTTLYRGMFNRKGSGCGIWIWSSYRDKLMYDDRKINY